MRFCTAINMGKRAGDLPFLFSSKHGEKELEICLFCSVANMGKRAGNLPFLFSSKHGEKELDICLFCTAANKEEICLYCTAASRVKEGWKSTFSLRLVWIAFLVSVGCEDRQFITRQGRAHCVETTTKSGPTQSEWRKIKGENEKNLKRWNLEIGKNFK